MFIAVPMLLLARIRHGDAKNTPHIRELDFEFTQRYPKPPPLDPLDGFQPDLSSDENLRSMYHTDLMVVMDAAHDEMFQVGLRQSLELFYPKNLLNLILVTESEGEFVEKSNAIDYVTVKPCSPDTAKTGGGHSRQQYDMFIADYYTDSEYVGFVDTDAVFISPALPETMFDNGKPIVKGVRGKPWEETFWAKVPSNTYRATHMLEVGNFMTYFPVIIKTAHLKEIRDHIMGVMGHSNFVDAFNEIRQGETFSQFCIMFNYIEILETYDQIFYILGYFSVYKIIIF